MVDIKNYEAWFVTGSQHLYGDETLKKVAQNSESIVDSLNKSKKLPVKIIFKPVLTTPESIYNLCLEANTNKNCVGLILWMHTFSPAKMWINGLKILNKPFVHLHTQFNRDIPWDSIDMDFMNLNQSAHGDREFGYICTRMRKPRKVIVGYWQDEKVQNKLSIWLRAAIAWQDAQGARIARFGDNMREVAVTEGDKVEAQMKFGYSVNGYGVGDLVNYINKVSDDEVEKLIQEYYERYEIAKNARKDGENYSNLVEAAKIEIALRNFLKNGNFKGFTTTFENLHGLKQLPGLAVQRLMAEGYGFGAEGDWKTAALLRAVKVMSVDLDGGTSFMEDYTYHLEPENMMVLGAHMLEICESLADDKPRLEIHPLSIGGKDAPPRLVFDVKAGEALNVSLIDLGNRFRMIVNEIKVIDPPQKLPKLPIARAIWIPKPNLEISAIAWIFAGGAHHTVFSKAITPEYLEDFSDIANIEFLLINGSTNISDFKKQLYWNDSYFSHS